MVGNVPLALTIFLVQILYVTLVTVRWILLVRGARYLAAAMSFFEILLYVYALGLVVTNLNHLNNILAYAAGYAVGCLAGSWVEARLAFGFTVLEMITPQASDLAPRLRDAGFAVTEVIGNGRDGERRILTVCIRRKLLNQLSALVNEFEPEAVVFEIETRSVRRGFLANRITWPQVVAPAPMRSKILD